MKIAIDFREAYNGRGIGRYVKEIVLELAKLDHQNIYFLFITSKDKPLELPSNFIFIKSPYFHLLDRVYFVFFEQFILPYLVYKYSPDILWCPGNTFPLKKLSKTKLFVTIHDLIFFKDSIKPKKLYQKLGKWYRRYMINRGNHRIYKIFTVSEYSKKELKELFPKYEPRVTYNKIGNFISNEKVMNDDILSTYNVNPENYFYTVSGDAPNKNLITLLEIYRDFNIKEKLVISGLKDFKTSWVYKFIIDHNLESKVILTKKLSDDELHSLYKNCKLFIFISISEGFGIPILEAMTYRRPILTSNTTSIPEVGGKGVIQCDPLSKEEIFNILSNVDSIDWLPYTNMQGIQIKKFSDWKDTAQIVLDHFLRN